METIIVLPFLGMWLLQVLDIVPRLTDWLILFNIISSMSIHVTVCVWISLFFLRLSHCPWSEFLIFSVSTFVDGDLGCFHLLAVMSNAAVNTHAQIPPWVPASDSFRYNPKVACVSLWCPCFSLSSVLLILYYFCRFCPWKTRWRMLAISQPSCLWECASSLHCTSALQLWATCALEMTSRPA